MRAPSQLAFAAGLVLTASSCGGGEGSYRVTIYGEAYIEEGIPADVFVDGWAITFDEFLIVVGDITLADGAAAIDGWRVFDLAQPSGGDGHELGRVAVHTNAVARFERPCVGTDIQHDRAAAEASHRGFERGAGA